MTAASPPAQVPGRWLPLISLAGAILATGAGLGTLAFMRPAPVASGPIVSQKERAFWPSAMVVGQGDTVTILNDDGNTIHHAYSEDAGFDSGDQLPGTSTPVTFANPGTFTVLCGIHPKMNLTVKVEPRR